MQVEATNFSSSSPLSSLVTSSNPSIEPAPPIGPKAKVTYSRRPIAAEESNPPSSSQPASPSDHLFDTPMRSYSRITASRKGADAADQDANDVTVTAEVSPATTAPAANSASKPGASSLFRRNPSHSLQPSDDDDDDDNAERKRSSRDSPAVHSGKRFQFGMARAIFDSDSEGESNGARAAGASQLGSNDKNDDDAIIARIRAQTVRDADSDPFTGSLSSLTSSQAQSSLQRSPSGFHDDEHMATEDGSTAPAHRRGEKVSAMRGRSGKLQRSKFSSSSDREGSAPSDDDPWHARKSRSFKLASSPSSTSAPPADHAPETGPSTVTAATLRREKMEALAAKARLAQGGSQAEVDAEGDPLLDAFFGGGSAGRIPSRSPSLDIQSSDEDEHNDAMPGFMAPSSNATQAKAKSRCKKFGAPAAEQDILSDLEDDVESADAKAASKRAAATKGRAPPKVKPLSKREIETMHRQTARLARENRPRLAATHQKKTIGLGELLSKITASDALRSNSSQGASGSNPTDGVTGEEHVNDSSAQPSSQIPSGQSKSQHASDPIESDSIAERSSPHPNYSSSPVVAVSRQQEQRLGLDPYITRAHVLQAHGDGRTAASRVAGVATRQDDAARTNRLLSGANDNDLAELPDLASIVKQTRDRQEAQKEAAHRQQQLREMKLRLLEKSRQQQHTSETAADGVASASGSADKQPAEARSEDEDDLILYKPGSLLAQKHHLPSTPGKKRPTDLLYREIGIRPGKTPPSHKTYVGVNADGSPNRSASADHAKDQDELVVTDAQLRTAGRALFVASDQAAGRAPETQIEAVSTQVRQDDTHPAPSTTQTSARTGVLKMTQAQLNATLMRKMQSQSLKARSQKEIKDALAKVDKHGRAAAPDVKALLERLGGAADPGGHNEPRNEADEDEDDPDFIMPAARNAESVIGSEIDMGSASENEAADDVEDLIDMGSADEEEGDQGFEEASNRHASEEAEGEHDSEKENAPPASQRSHGSDASPSLNRSLLPSRAVMDDDEDELAAPRATVRRGRHSRLADEDAEEEGDEHPLQPGPFDSSRDNARDGAVHSQQPPRIPLGDISSQSLDQSMPFSRSNTSSPAIQHTQPPGAASPARRDALLFSLMAGQDDDESFRTDDIPSQAANDLGRFFEPTLPPPDAAKSGNVASQLPHKSFWDQTQTQTQTQSQSQEARPVPSSTRAPAASADPRELVRDASGNSALGAFFQDTQQDELRGESLDIFENATNAGGKAKGFTQFFFDGTPPASAASASNAGPSVWDASTMPPPKSTEVDAFAALRKAQMGEAMDRLDTTPSVLPSFDESQAEREAYAQAQGQADQRSPEKMYMNRDGFFTQTKPSQQTGLWSQYDSQSQSQSQLQAATLASARRGSNVSVTDAGQVGFASDDDPEDEGPVPLKRLRRGVAAQAAAQSDVRVGYHGQSDADSENEENDPPSSQPEPRPRNAFDVLRQGPNYAEDDEPISKGKKRKSAFIEGEAEESEDEELGGKKRGDGGGLEGVFADADGNGSGADEDEDDEDDADAADLQELVDNERELDEAQKDEIARARFREDMEAKDREDLEIHQRAAQGGYRNRRGRGAGLNGIDGYLDDDADDEELKRRAAMGLHMSAGAKKRKLLDGTEDGMDALAAHDEARAFVQSYAATHQIDHESEKYEFLAAPLADDDDDDDSSDDDAKEDESMDDEGGELVRKDHRAGDEDVEADTFGPVVSKQPSKIRFDEVRAVIQQRRQAKRRTTFDEDDEDEDNAAHRRADDGWDSDEDDAETRLAAALHDRIKGVSSRAPAAPAAPQQKKKKHGMQYGRKAPRTAATDAVDAMELDSDPFPDPEAEEADDDASGSLMARLLSQPASRPSFHRPPSSSMALDMLEDAEPEWGNDAHLVRAPKPSAAGPSQSSSSSSSSLAKLPTGTLSFRAAQKKAKVGATPSLLLSKQGIMRRESGFSSSSSR